MAPDDTTGPAIVPCLSTNGRNTLRLLPDGRRHAMWAFGGLDSPVDATPRSVVACTCASPLASPPCYRQSHHVSTSGELGREVVLRRRAVNYCKRVTSAKGPRYAQTPRALLSDGRRMRAGRAQSRIVGAKRTDAPTRDTTEERRGHLVSLRIIARPRPRIEFRRAETRGRARRSCQWPGRRDIQPHVPAVRAVQPHRRNHDVSISGELGKRGVQAQGARGCSVRIPRPVRCEPLRRVARGYRRTEHVPSEGSRPASVPATARRLPANDRRASAGQVKTRRIDVR
ncbi:uncharacterized protein B0H18DRAFT_26900 [Fomitopsis serialis]|uniref:uncharacterized protein n=1 Tax=Fomitopsis serialis TaxID=139415 RepID=UPI002008AAB2|nr:uncharacterized protein B0H18DRAFT_26900 [Neoantrodia serialis]KAH9932491.1 hypothetical protein B0H18DRAFT_26900 [Neoantrodia serialis]